MTQTNSQTPDAQETIRDLQEENDLLLVQLHMVQEELEQMFLNQQQQATFLQPTDTSAAVPVRPFKYEKLLNDPKINVPADTQIQQLEKQLSQLIKSTSWGLLWPVRFLGSIIRGRLPKKQQVNRGKTDEQYIENLEGKIEQIQGSRSWRLTAPVRNVRFLFRSNHPQVLSWQKKSYQQQQRTKKLFDGLKLAKDDNNNLLIQVDQCQQQIFALKKNNSNVEADNRAQLNQLKRDKAEAENKFKKQLDLLTEQSATNEARLKVEYERVIEEASTREAGLKQDLAAATEQSAANEATLKAELEQLIAKLKQESERFTTEQKTHQETLKESEVTTQKLKEHQRLLTESQTKVAELQKHNQQLQTENKETQQRQTQLEAELIKAEAQIDVIKEIMLSNFSSDKIAD